MGQNASFFGYALNDVQAGGVDIILESGVVTLTGVGSFPWDKVQTQIVKTVYAAAVARETVLTFGTPVAGDEFNVNISQPQGSNNVFPQLFSIVSTGTSATTVAQAFKTAFNNAVANGILFGTATGNADAITITGSTEFPMLRVNAASANITVSVSIAGNPEVNGGAQLLSQGVENAEAGKHYTTFAIQNLTATGDFVEDGIFRQLIYAVDEDATNGSDLIARMAALFSGAISAGSPNVVNLELISKLAK